jgi:hypothetical protein
VLEKPKNQGEGAGAAWQELFARRPEEKGRTLVCKSLTI